MTDKSLGNLIDLCDEIPLEVFGSLNNAEATNPFDVAEKQAQVPDDVFEMVVREAERSRDKGAPDVKTENLLLLDDLAPLSSAELPSKELVGRKSSTQLTIPDISRLGSVTSNRSNSASSMVSGDFSAVSPISPYFHSFKNESSLTLNKGFLGVDSTISNGGGSDRSETNSKLNKAFMVSSLEATDNSAFANNTQEDRRKSEPEHLVKQVKKIRSSSLTNSTLSPSQRNHLLKLSLSNSSLNSPLRRLGGVSTDSSDKTVFFEASYLADRLSQMVVSISPRLSIDSCDDLNAINPNWVDSETDLDSDLEMFQIPILQKIDSPNCQDQIFTENVIKKFEKHKEVYVESIKQEQPAEAAEINNDPDSDDESFENLLKNLKNKILKCSDPNQKSKANTLLENLSLVLHSGHVNSIDGDTQKTDELMVPAPIIRQGTFDLDKPEPRDKIDDKSEEDHDQTLENSPEKVSPEVNKIVEHIGKLFGSQNVSVLESSSLSSASGAANPTYIVVMGTSSAPGYHSNAPDLNTASQMRTRRSQSVSIHDKPRTPTVESMNPRPGYPNNFTTPVRPVRRNSISNSPRTSSTVNSRRLVAPPPPQNQRRSVLAPVPQEKSLPFKPEINFKNLRVKASESSNRPQGPLKARMAPMMVTPSVSSPIDGRSSKPVTSTPLVSSLNAFPKACSTPTPAPPQCETSPPHALSNLRRKVRYSNYQSATPNPKANIGHSSSMFNRRRSMSTDVKSPRKGGESMVFEKPQVRPLKLPEDLPKSRIGSQRRSISNMCLGKPRTELGSFKNKENKLSK